MRETEKTIENLNMAKFILCNQQMLTSEMCTRIGQIITDTIALLTEQEEIIEKYHKADVFLNAHGWIWDNLK